MRFRFRLQRVLDLALVRERRKLNQLAASRQREQVLKLYLESGREQLRKSLGRMASDPGSPMAPFLATSVELAQSEIQRMEATLVEERQAQTKMQEELMKLVLRRKAFEKLRETRFAEFRLERVRAEQKEIDEVAGRNWKPPTDG